MKHAWRMGPSSFLALLLILIVAGCGSPLKARFYTLSPAAEIEHPANRPAYMVAVGPATIPSAVERPQIVLRAGGNRVTLAEDSRWAEPLKDSIPRVIAGNLASMLNGAQVAAYSQSAAAAADYRVLLDIQRFDSALGDAATLEVLWTVVAVNGGAASVNRSLVREPADGPDYDALVAAHNRALAAVSRDIAAEVREVSAEDRPKTLPQRAY